VFFFIQLATATKLTTTVRLMTANVDLFFSRPAGVQESSPGPEPSIRACAIQNVPRISIKLFKLSLEFFSCFFPEPEKI
jgi:hypothetical protein